MEIIEHITSPKKIAKKMKMFFGQTFKTPQKKTQKLMEKKKKKKKKKP